MHIHDTSKEREQRKPDCNTMKKDILSVFFFFIFLFFILFLSFFLVFK